MSNCFSCYDNLVKLENDTTMSAHKTDVIRIMLIILRYSFKNVTLVDTKDVLKTTDRKA